MATMSKPDIKNSSTPSSDWGRNLTIIFCFMVMIAILISLFHQNTNNQEAEQNGHFSSGNATVKVDGNIHEIFFTPIPGMPTVLLGQDAPYSYVRMVPVIENNTYYIALIIDPKITNEEIKATTKVRKISSRDKNSTLVFFLIE